SLRTLAFRARSGRGAAVRLWRFRARCRGPRRHREREPDGQAEPGADMPEDVQARCLVGHDLGNRGQMAAVPYGSWRRQGMSRVSDARPFWWRRCAAGLLVILAGCSQLPPTSSVAIPPVPAAAGRIWIYRNDYQYESQQTPYVWLNGQITGVSQPNGAFYRDVPPG